MRKAYHDYLVGPGRECGEFRDACKRAADYANRKGGGIEAAERFIVRAGWIHATCGVESVSECGRSMEYLNTGDTYTTTVICEGTECSVGSWGAWVESVENEYNDENDTIKCAHCSNYTPVAEPWDCTVCNYCRNYVDGSGGNEGNES